MYRKCLSGTVIMMLLAPMTVAVASIGQAGGLGLGAPDYIPGRNPQTTDDDTSTVGRAAEAINATVGMPDIIKKHVLSQVGGKLGQAGGRGGNGTPFAFGLGIAGEAGQQDGAESGNTPEEDPPPADPDDAADTETGGPPDPFPGLGNAADHMSDRAKEALGTVADKLEGMAGVEQTQQTDQSARQTALTGVAERLRTLIAPAPTDGEQ